MVDGGETAEASGHLARRTSRQQQTWVTVLLGVVILLSGVAIGLGVGMLWLPKSPSDAHRPPAMVATDIARDMAKEFGLGEEQTARIREIHAKRLEAMDKIRRETVEKVLAEHDTLREQLKAELTPEQFERWDKRFVEAQKRGRFHRRGRGRGPGLGRGRGGGGPGFGPGGPGFGPGREGGSHRGPPDPMETFRRLDADRDGRLTPAELRTMPEPLRSRLLEADKNADGTITLDELKQGHPFSHPFSRPFRPPTRPTTAPTRRAKQPE